MKFYLSKMMLVLGTLTLIQHANGMTQIVNQSYVHTSSQHTNISSKSSSSNVNVNFKPTISPGMMTSAIPGMGGNPMAPQQKPIEPPITTPASMHCPELGGAPPPQPQYQPQPIIVYVVQEPAPVPSNAVVGG